LPKYVIEREVPGIQMMAPQQLKALAQSSCSILQKMGPKIQWIESYVTDDKLYCVYYATSEDLIREHAVSGNFPANRISKVHRMIEPATSE
jgi:Nickel responsive protein SCO4226-like